ncbi:MAG: ParB/Srx family N-terminal domain-containing protein [Gammaproteobacteria bacterium]|jgi:ParB-like chromosome segregation protein Spo0J
MLTTKRYEYLRFDNIQIHPDVSNHRPLDVRKVAHYEEDIYRNGLLEPLVVWEKGNRDYFLVGGFHRLAAINAIRAKHPGYFDSVDTRVVAGSLDEIRALNLKLNADRLDTKITDYFDTVIYLNNANWPKGRIAEFLDKSVPWIEEILRYAPTMDQRLRVLLEDGRVSWNRAKQICRLIQEAPAGREQEVLDREIKALSRDNAASKPHKKPLTFRIAEKRLRIRSQNQPKSTFTVGAEDLLCLLLVLQGKRYNDEHLQRVHRTFPGLLEEQAPDDKD